MNIMLPESHEREMRPRWWMNISIVRLFPWNYAEEQNQESRFGQYFYFFNNLIFIYFIERNI